jgi:Fe-S oxidoreductase
MMNYQRVEQQVSLVHDFVYKNLMKEYVPLPIDRAACARWARDLPRVGPTIIYTSYMYQLGSVFKSYAKLLKRFSGVKFASRFASLGGLLVKPKREELERASMILNNVVALLKGAGVEVSYLYADEPYSGALLLELGLLDEFEEYGRKLFGFMGDRGVKRLVTVDPHTMNALLRLKERLRSELDVVNYLQLIRPTGGGGSFAMHDSCLYSRYLGLGPSVRSVLRGAGVNLIDDRMVTAQDTSTCCGAPVESVDEELSEQIAKDRAAKLLSVHRDILVACPLCYQNLSPYIGSIRDVAEVIR